jgi:hypothetical protein
MCDDNNEDAVRQLRRQVSELTKEVAYLKDALHRDKTGLAHALGAVRVLVRGYGWLSQNGVWASYGDEEQTEKTLRDEMSACLNEVDTVALDALSVSGDLASASKQGKPLALTLPDYANLCQALLDELKRKRQPCNMCEDFEPAERTLGDWGTCQHEDASLLNGAEYTCEKFAARTCSQDNPCVSCIHFAPIGIGRSGTCALTATLNRRFGCTCVLADGTCEHFEWKRKL